MRRRRPCDECGRESTNPIVWVICNLSVAAMASDNFYIIYFRIYIQAYSYWWWTYAIHIQYMNVPYTRVFMYVFSATNARKQLSFCLEPEFRSLVAFCARFAAPFVHKYIQTSLRMPRTAICEYVCVCVLFAQCVNWHLCIYRIRFNCFNYK